MAQERPMTPWHFSAVALSCCWFAWLSWSPMACTVAYPPAPGTLPGGMPRRSSAGTTVGAQAPGPPGPGAGGTRPGSSWRWKLPPAAPAAPQKLRESPKMHLAHLPLGRRQLQVMWLAQQWRGDQGLGCPQSWDTCLLGCKASWSLYSTHKADGFRCPETGFGRMPRWGSGILAVLYLLSICFLNIGTYNLSRLFPWRIRFFFSKKQTRNHLFFIQGMPPWKVSSGMPPSWCPLRGMAAPSWGNCTWNWSGCSMASWRVWTAQCLRGLCETSTPRSAACPQKAGTPWMPSIRPGTGRSACRCSIRKAWAAWARVTLGIRFGNRNVKAGWGWRALTWTYVGHQVFAWTLRCSWPLVSRLCCTHPGRTNSFWNVWKRRRCVLLTLQSWSWVLHGVQGVRASLLGKGSCSCPAWRWRRRFIIMYTGCMPSLFRIA